MIKQLSLSLLASLLLATAAMADGMVGHAAPAGCTGGAFSGGYVGAAIGAGWQDTSNDNRTLGITVDGHDKGTTFGGYVGYNFQRCCCDRYVLGVEADINYLDSAASGHEIEFGPGGTETTTLTSKMDWFGTLRARAGIVVHDNWLLYATGGLAYARVDQSIYNDCVGCGNSSFNLGTFYQSNGETKYGWTLGGGVEFAHDEHWLFRAEALYLDLGTNERTYVIDTPIATATSVNRWDDQFWVARLGLTYRFGSRDEAVPLK